MANLAHQYLRDGIATDKFNETLAAVMQTGYNFVDNITFCQDYITVFNTGTGSLDVAVSSLDVSLS